MKKLAVTLLLGLGLAACGGGSSSPSSPTAPAGPSQAQVVVTCLAPVTTYSPRFGFTYRATFTCNVNETAGVGINVNYVRADFVNSAGTGVERQELSSADLITQLGTNHINGGNNYSAHLLFDFNAPSSVGGTLTFSVTDDRLNVLTATFVFRLV
jgi:hypothetical protein